MLTRTLLEQAVISCTYQEDLSLDSIKRYVRAARYAEKIDSFITISDIKKLGIIICGRNKGFRVTPVTFGNGKVGAPYSQITRLLETLCEANKEGYLTPDEFFIAFEKIHPFNDGNGRVGEIIFWKQTGNFNCPHWYFKDKE